VSRGADARSGETAPRVVHFEIPVVCYGSFVMNSERELQPAFADFRGCRLGVIPAGAFEAHGTVAGEIAAEG